MIPPVLASLLVVALWVAAWLHWFFVGDLRRFLFNYVFPSKWRGGLTRAELSSGDLQVFLAMSPAPSFVSGVLSCPGCLSAHLSAVGTFIAVVAFLPWAGCVTSPSVESILPLLFAPALIWAGGAWLGHRLHRWI